MPGATVSAAALAAASSGFSVAALLPLLSIVSVLIVAAGIIGASFRLARNTTTVANYREAATSWESKSNAQDAELGDLQRNVKELQDKVAEKDIQITSLQAQVASLRDLLLQRAPIEALEAGVSRNHDLLTASHEIVVANQNSLEELLRRTGARQASG